MGNHIPQRMCVSCREMSDKDKLIKFVRDKESGAVIIDAGQKLMGRGAYICKNEECIKKACKRNSLARHFKCSVSPELYAEAEKLILTER